MSEQQRSLSRYLSYNGRHYVATDEDGKPCEGKRISEDKCFILRFHDGLLDGDIYNAEGKVVMTKPAVEAPGHIEYWRQGNIHRDNGLPAITGNNFMVNEWWRDGHRQPDPKRTPAQDLEVEHKPVRHRDRDDGMSR